jgi:hypothetical protein
LTADVADEVIDPADAARWVGIRGDMAAQRAASRLPASACEHALNGTGPIRVRGLCGQCDALVMHPDRSPRPYVPGEHRWSIFPAADDQAA